jgi:hypothetical protein
VQSTWKANGTNKFLEEAMDVVKSKITSLGNKIDIGTYP